MVLTRYLFALRRRVLRAPHLLSASRDGTRLSLGRAEGHVYPE